MATGSLKQSHHGLANKPSSRHSSVAPLRPPVSQGSDEASLAPLEFLQNQRRGSITDPFLHATPRQSINSQFFRQDKNNPSEPRPASPYVFGSAGHGDGSHLRKLLRSPSPNSRDTVLSSAGSFRGSGTPKNDTSDAMNVDAIEQHPPTAPHPARAKLMSHESHTPFDYTMRRHSIAVGQDTHTRSPSRLGAPQGLKRKMSADPSAFPAVGEEGDVQHGGAGASGGMDVDSEAPAPKRRGSAIDTQRIAQLSLNDRRDSLDARGSQWRSPNDRRSSTSSMFSSVSSVGGYSSRFSENESPHGRPPPSIASFSWPSRPSDSPGGFYNETDGSLPAASKSKESGIIVVPPINFPPDRRMSITDSLSGPSVKHQRSRSPRQKPNAEASSHGSPDDSSPPTTAKLGPKEIGTAPYSRSPELRVSHKLAERKRRKEMKELFDELREQLPADRGLKASKWEILSKAIDFVAQLKQSHQDMAHEIEVLRRELDTFRPGSYPPLAIPPHGFSQSSSSNGPVHSPSRPSSSQNSYSSTENGSPRRREDSLS